MYGFSGGALKGVDLKSLFFTRRFNYVLFY